MYKNMLLKTILAWLLELLSACFPLFYKNKQNIEMIWNLSQVILVAVCWEESNCGLLSSQVHRQKYTFLTSDHENLERWKVYVMRQGI